MLGVGFRLAMRDLEIRGAGNLLGAQQSGHIAAVGYEMYCQLLEEAVAGLTASPRTRSADHAMEIGLAGAIPRTFIPSERRRLEAYRRISGAETLTVLRQAAQDIESAYGAPPPAMRTLLDLAELRVLLAAAGAHALARRDRDYIFQTRKPALVRDAFARTRASVRFVGTPDDAGWIEVFVRPEGALAEPARMLKFLRESLERIVAASESAA
jgi:transcription-repair coupling factor (superfamily II helicase)